MPVTPLRATAALLAAVVVAAGAPAGAASAAPDVPRAATLVTTKVVAEQRRPAGSGGGPDLNVCSELARLFDASSRSERVFAHRDDADLRYEQEDEVITCSVRFAGRPAPAALARDLRAARAARPQWTWTTAPDRVHGLVLAVKRGRISAHGEHFLLNRLPERAGVRVESQCAGGGIDKVTTMSFTTFTPVPPATVARLQADVARVLKVPSTSVRRLSPWTAPARWACWHPRR